MTKKSDEVEIKIETGSTTGTKVDRVNGEMGEEGRCGGG